MSGYIKYLRSLNETDRSREVHRKISRTCFDIVDTSAFCDCSTEETADKDWTVTDLMFIGDKLTIHGEEARLPFEYTAGEREALHGITIDGEAVAVFDDEGNVSYEEVEAKVRTD